MVQGGNGLKGRRKRRKGQKKTGKKKEGKQEKIKEEGKHVRVHRGYKDRKKSENQALTKYNLCEKVDK